MEFEALLKDELTTRLRIEKGASYNEGEGDDIAKKIASYANKLLNESKIKGTKRELERPQPHPQQNLGADGSDYPTPAHSTSKVPTFATSRNGSSHNAVQRKSRFQQSRMSTSSQNINSKLMEQVAQQNSLQISDSMMGMWNQDFFNGDISLGFDDSFQVQSMGMDLMQEPFMSSDEVDPTHDDPHDQKRTKVGHDFALHSGPSLALQNSGLAQHNWNQMPSNHSQNQQFVRQPVAPRKAGPSNQNFSYLPSRPETTTKKPSRNLSKDVPQDDFVRSNLRNAGKAAHINPRFLNNIHPAIKGENELIQTQKPTLPIRITARTSKERVLQPALSTTSSSTPSLTQPSFIPKLKSERNEKYTVSNPKAQRKRRYKTVYCRDCNKKPEGFRGPHELARHKARQHQTLKVVYIIKDISGHAWLSNCKNCSRRKTYGQDYNAAAHLRRAHFNKPQKGDTEIEKQSKLANKDEPSMEVLRGWMERVLVDAKKLIENKYLDAADDAIVPELKHEDELEDDADCEEYSEEEESYVDQQSYQAVNMHNMHTSPLVQQPMSINPSTLPDYENFDDNIPSSFGNNVTSNYSTHPEWPQTFFESSDQIPRFPSQDLLGQSRSLFLDHLDVLGIDATRLENLPPPDLSQQTTQMQMPSLNHNVPRTVSLNPTESFADSEFMNDYALSDLSAFDGIDYGTHHY